MGNAKSASKINEEKRIELISFLRDNINSRSALTTHRELSVWAAVVLYLTFIMILFKLYFEKTCLFQNFDFKIRLSIFLGFILFAILALIHAQYGAHVSARSLGHVCGEYILKLINCEEDPEDDKWKKEGDGYLPKFIQNEIKTRNEKFHKWILIGPWIIFLWAILRLYKAISSCKVLEFDKIQLIESSIYCMIIIPTFFFYAFIWPNLLHDAIMFLSHKVILF